MNRHIDKAMQLRNETPMVMQYGKTFKLMQIKDLKNMELKMFLCQF